MRSSHPEKKSQWEVFVLGRGANGKWLFWEEMPMGSDCPRERNQWEVIVLGKAANGKWLS